MRNLSESIFIKIITQNQMSYFNPRYLRNLSGYRHEFDQRPMQGVPPRGHAFRIQRPTNCGLLTHIFETLFPHRAFTVSQAMRPPPRRANVDTMCILLYRDVTMQKGSCSPFFRRYYGRVGLLLHLHSASTHAATGYWPYDMLTNIPMFSKDRLSTLPRLDQSPRKCIFLFTLSMRPSGGRCTVMNASI